MHIAVCIEVLSGCEELEAVRTLKGLHPQVPDTIVSLAIEDGTEGLRTAREATIKPCPHYYHKTALFMPLCTIQPNFVACSKDETLTFQAKSRTHIGS